MKRITFFVFLFISICGFSQNVEISGTVLDSSASQLGLKNAVAVVTRLFDSTLVGYARTDNKGVFKLVQLPVDTYQVVISHPSFGDKYFLVLASKSRIIFDFGKITMPPKNIELNEVVIFAEKDPVYYKGDTLVYVADSFKVGANANVEELIKKLPGMKVDAEGKITFQGKQIEQVFVDGDEFFGTDPTVATKNLNANAIESVQVFDKKNEEASGNDEEAVKVMNLKLKEDAKKGYFGKLTAASDFTDYYEGEMLANKFNNKQKISVFGLYSNTPRSQFNWSDVFTYGLNDERNFSEGDDGTFYFNQNSTPQGVPKTTKTGFYYSDKYGKNTKITTNYTYAANELNSLSETSSQYFLIDTSYTVNNFGNAYQQTESHSIKINLVQKVDSLTEIEIIPSYKFSSNKKDQSNTADFFTIENIASRSTHVINHNNARNNDFNGSFRLSKSFKKKERKLYVLAKYGLTDQNYESILKSDEVFYDSFSVPVDSIDQEKISVLQKKTSKIYTRYTEPINSKFKVQLSYDYATNYEIQNKNTKDFFNGEYSLQNDSFSNHFQNSRTTNILGLTLNYDVKKTSFYIGADLRDITVLNANIISGERIYQDVKNILPYSYFRYKFSTSRNMELRYQTSSSQPSIFQMQPVPDNSNPNNITLGNPGLLPTFRHKFSTRFNSHKSISNKYIWSGASYSIVNNAFANSSTYDTLGRNISQTVNVQGNQNGDLYIGANYPLINSMLFIQPDLNAFYNRSTNYINGLANKTTEYGMTAGLDFSLEYKKLFFTLGGSYSYRDPKSTISSASNKPYSNQVYRSSVNLKLPKKTLLRTDVNYNINTRRSQGYNIDYLIWNMGLEKTFLKTDNLIASVNATDILNQNINAYRTVNDNVIVDNKTVVIGRYILARLVYKFNSNKSKPEDEGF